MKGVKEAADIQNLGYAWDALGNLTSRTDHSGSKRLRGFDANKIRPISPRNPFGEIYRAAD